ncbi:MAG: phosphoribosylanthranilate isomerase [Oscillospiraceae bacterium]|nr:phosphoribosylanthranilate isomerase [Oscillospiraceae bacterium]
MSRVKICGLSRAEDIMAVNAAKPDYIGFVFAPSHRRIDEAKATMLRKDLDDGISVVGVFVDNDIDSISKLYRNGVIDIAQLHGDEDESYIEKLKDMCDCPVIKAISIHESLPPYPKNADYLLFDALSNERGGTGKTFNWEILRDFNGLPYFLAGGLDASNVRAAIEALSSFCVDASSGVETSKLKDAAKILAFTQTARGEFSYCNTP